VDGRGRVQSSIGPHPDGSSAEATAFQVFPAELPDGATPLLVRSTVGQIVIDHEHAEVRLYGRLAGTVGRVRAAAAGFAVERVRRASDPADVAFFVTPAPPRLCRAQDRADAVRLFGDDPAASTLFVLT